MRSARAGIHLDKVEARARLRVELSAEEHKPPTQLGLTPAPAEWESRWLFSR